MDEAQDPEGTDLNPIEQLSAVPGLARIAAGAWYRGAMWGVDSTFRATRRVTEAALSGESAAELIEDVRDETVNNLRRMLGVVEGEDNHPITDAFNAVAPEPGDREKRQAGAGTLRERGGRLLERASDVEGGENPVHPGFERIVDQLAPDEARILKLLANEGPQPIVYINKAGPMGIGAREIARRLSLIGPEAGCLRPDLVPAYLDNLVRLGLVAIRRDPCGDEQDYQVVEAQPEVVEAMKSVSGPVFSGQSSRRSVHITEFGKAFCRVCFPPEHLTGEVAAVDVLPDSEAEVAPPEIDADAGTDSADR